MTTFYTDASYDHSTKEATFGVYCPSNDYKASFYLSDNLSSNLKAEYLAIKGTVRIIKSKFKNSEMAEEFLLYSDCLIAIDRWNTNDYLPEDNIEVCWISRNSDGIKVADTLAYRKRITTLI